MHMTSVRIDFGVRNHRRDRVERSFSRSIRVVCLQSSLALDQRRRLESGYKHRLRRVTVEASSWDTAEALRDKDFVPCKSSSSSHRPSPGKLLTRKSQINAFYETVVAARGRDVLGPPDGSCHRVAREHGH